MDDEIEQAVKEAKEAFEAMKNVHPALTDLSANAMQIVLGSLLANYFHRWRPGRMRDSKIAEFFHVTLKLVQDKDAVTPKSVQ